MSAANVVFIGAAVVAFNYLTLLEYCAHRWIMHFPGLGRNAWWRDHALEHHGKHRNDVNITLSAWIIVAGNAPLLLLGTWLGWGWIVFVLAESVVYAGFWSALHAAYHNVGFGGAIVRKLPFYKTWLDHHLRHHAQPSKNFGAVFIWTDWLFGTTVSNHA